MFIPVITEPWDGFRLAELPRNVRALALALEPVVIEAAIALDLFNEASLYRDASMPDIWWVDEPEKQAEFANVEVPSNRPKKYFDHAVHLHARTFALSLRIIGVLIETLAEETAEDKVEQIAQDFTAKFPKLRELRNSISHIEDRLRGLRERKQPIVLQSAPGLVEGGVALFNDFLVENSNGAFLNWTIADGSIGACPISEKTLRIAVDQVNRVLAALIGTDKDE